MKSVLIPSDFRFTPKVENKILFCNDKSEISINFVDERIVRIVHKPEGFLDPPAQTAIGIGNIQPNIVNQNDGLMTVSAPNSAIQLDISYKSDFALSFKDAATRKIFLQDLPWRAYEFDQFGGCHHYFKNNQESYYGLGEKTGRGLKLNKRFYRLATSDAMGYDAECTDPLYKHVPFYIALSREGTVAYGVYFNTTGLGSIDFGCEIDALWGSYTSFKSESHTALDMYIIYGPNVEDVVKGFAKIVGTPALIPKYAYGYLASSMGYAEAENAQSLLEEFPLKLEEHKIPCDVLHLSSGYTVDPKTGQRNVFTWNKGRFPDPKKLFTLLRHNGIKTVANVKPWLLVDHPKFEEMSRENALVWNPRSKSSAQCRLWAAGAGESGMGSYIDLMGKEGREFWKDGVKELLDVGLDGIWNDNNEFSTIADDFWQIGDWNESLGEKPVKIGEIGGRALLTVFMATASYEAMLERHPNTRPYLISRAMTTGTHRYASSWSGDNYTSWHSLKHNIPMGLHAGLSLLSNYGHDIGGFAGPQPDPELLLRWIQCGIYFPRFCIHSWKKEGITEPWMYPAILSHVREAIQFRYKLVPYLYNLGYSSHYEGTPIIRPTFYSFQQDPQTHEQAFDFMLGPYLLVSPIYEMCAVEKSVYLPNGKVRYFDIFNKTWFKGGQRVTCSVPLHQAGAVFALSGSIIPINSVPGRNTEDDSSREIWLFIDPESEGRSQTIIIDDDGTSLNPALLKISIDVVWQRQKVQVSVKVLDQSWSPRYSELRFILQGSAGTLFTISLIIISGYFYFFLPSPSLNSVENVKIHETKKSPEEDPQLSFSGPLRVSNEALSMTDVQRTTAIQQQQQAIAKRASNWMGKLSRTYAKGKRLSSFIISRFLGDSSSLPVLDDEQEEKTETVETPYADVFAVLKHKTLFFYKDHEMVDFIRVVMMPEFEASLFPTSLADHELFMPQWPIVLTSKTSTPIFLYPPTSSEKESWFVILKRASQLPIFADQGAMSTFHQESDPVKKYNEAMKKLLSNTSGEGYQETAWLNAIVGRMFVAIHSNNTVKEWVINRLSRHTVETEDEPSLLGDIVIRDLDVGNSLPVLSNPKLTSISEDGDMLIEMDIDYTGGFQVVLATEATLSVPAWDSYMKPITVPVVVAVKMKRFSARVLIKIKPFWESNRIWFGFFRQPELKLELEVEPIISNKLIKLQMVNQVIERRIKDSLEAYVMLPNMDDLSFWDFTDLNGSPFGSEPFRSSNTKSQDVALKGNALVAESTKSSLLDAAIMDNLILESSNNPIISSSMMGEAQESNYLATESKEKVVGLKEVNETVEKETDLIERQTSSSASESHQDEQEDFRDALQDMTSESPHSDAPSADLNHAYVEYLGNAAYSLGQISRQYGLDTKAQQIATSVKDYATPALKFAEEKVQTSAAKVGLTAIEKLGLSPTNSNNSTGGVHDETQSEMSVAVSATSKALRHKTSTTWSLLGLSISTSAPSSERRRMQSKMKPTPISTDDLSTLDNSNSVPSPSSSIAESLSSDDLEELNLVLDDHQLI